MVISYFTSGKKSEDVSISPIIYFAYLIHLFLILQMIDYFLGYIADNFGNRPSANEGDRSELEFLRKTVA
jgi:hypothetical protein